MAGLPGSLARNPGVALWVRSHDVALGSGIRPEHLGHAGRYVRYILILHCYGGTRGIAMLRIRKESAIP
jgi:hypothetical protein